VIVASNTFDPATNTLTMDSVTVTGDRTYSNVVIRIDQFTVLGVGSSAPINGGVSETCGSENFTIDKFNAIQIGMSLDQVNQVIGCEFSRTVRAVSVAVVEYFWEHFSDSDGFSYISANFDPSSLTVTGLRGSTFKNASGL